MGREDKKSSKLSKDSREEPHEDVIDKNRQQTCLPESEPKTADICDNKKDDEASPADLTLDDLCFKIILIGDSGVGKSAITFRFCDNVFYEYGAPTLGVDFKYTRVQTLEKVPRIARLQVWDTAGQDTFLTLTTSFYRSAAGILICFDLTNRETFLNLDRWMERVKDNVGGVLPPIIVVGCKLDLAKSDSGNGSLGVPTLSLREVTEQEATAWCDENHVLGYFETSAKDRTNVDIAFQQLSTHVIRSTRMDEVEKGENRKITRILQRTLTGHQTSRKRKDKGCSC
eukprot:Tbor_TRINITY_DN4987_c5_g1::TRINITY_DN4987_c5_g1_i1::g.9809::m.9809